MALTIYGIPNCDTVRKVRQWLSSNYPQLAISFHDIRSQPLDSPRLARWLQQVGSEVLINKRSTTWRSLTPEQQALPASAAIIALLQEFPTLLKRPVLEVEQHLVVGFDPSTWQRALQDQA